MSKLLTVLWLILSLVIGISALAADTRTGSEYTEQMLSTRAYSIPPGKDVVAWLNDLIQTIDAHSIQNPTQHAVNLVLVGDAYHWIGHIFEERGEFARAWEMYVKSFQAYAATPFRRSAFITNLDTLSHARMHMAKIAPRVNGKIPQVQIVPAQQDNSTLTDGDSYHALLRDIKSTIIKCSAFF